MHYIVSTANIIFSIVGEKRKKKNAKNLLLLSTVNVLSNTFIEKKLLKIIIIVSNFYNKN
jgi:hypothetical protein